MDDLSQTLLDALRARGWKFACAESLTGGLFGATITRVPGMSDVFVGGMITYVDDAKKALLGVDAAFLEKHGAVHAEVATMMARGARERAGADLAVSFTGFAGPGAPGPQPVGRVFIGVATAEEARSHQFTFDGDRHAVRERSVREGIRLALEAAR